MNGPFSNTSDVMVISTRSVDLTKSNGTCRILAYLLANAEYRDALVFVNNNLNPNQKYQFRRIQVPTVFELYTINDCMMVRTRVSCNDIINNITTEFNNVLNTYGMVSALRWFAAMLSRKNTFRPQKEKQPIINPQRDNNPQRDDNPRNHFDGPRKNIAPVNRFN